MKIFIVQYTLYNGWMEIHERYVLKCYNNRSCANHYMVAEALNYAQDGYAVSLVNDGVYINTMKAERKYTKICEEEIIEITVREMEVI